MNVGDEYYDSEEFRELLAEYEKAMSTGMPVFMDADELSEVADYYQMQNLQEEAEKAIQQALQKAPGGIAPLTYRIHEALSEGDTKEARKFLSQITETNEPDYVYDQGEILIAEDRIEEADEFFRKEFMKIPPEEWQDFVIDVASIYSDYGISEKAMEWIIRAKQEDTPDFKELMARTFFGLGKYKDSERLFNELIDTAPFQKRYWSALAATQFMNEDYSNAIESSEYAIAIDPQDPDGLIAKANSLYRLGNYEEAEEYYRRYLQQEVDDEFALLHQATCLINMGKEDEAIELLNHATDVTDNTSPYLADIYQELSFAYSEKGEPDRAIDWLNKTDDLDCDHVQIMVIKGHVMLSAGRVEEAEIFFRKAVMRSNEPTHTLLRVIVSLYDNRYLQACYKMMKKYFQIAEEGNTEGYAYMALCCHDLNLHDEYLKYLKTACELNPQECRLVLSHLFPKDIEANKYYEYIINSLQS